jgi:hypothetical protein
VFSLADEATNNCDTGSSISDLKREMSFGRFVHKGNMARLRSTGEMRACKAMRYCSKEFQKRGWKVLHAQSGSK